MTQNGWVDEELFKKFRECMPIASVDILVIHAGKLLIMLRNNELAKGLWWTPGGRVMLSETLEQTVLRKLKDETGLEATKIEQKGVMSHFWPQVHYVTTFFRVDIANNQVKLNSEHKDYKWISEINDNLHPYVKHMIKKANIFT
ncbi:MAG: NUDIX domain-containing protein [Candidatus Bathyarchaeota archaeon]